MEENDRGRRLSQGEKKPSLMFLMKRGGLSSKGIFSKKKYCFQNLIIRMYNAFHMQLKELKLTKCKSGLKECLLESSFTHFMSFLTSAHASHSVYFCKYFVNCCDFLKRRRCLSSLLVSESEDGNKI